MTTNTAVLESPTERSAGRGIAISLWIVQGVLALGFGMAGSMKLTAPLGELAVKLGWPAAVPGPLVRFIGAAELLGALGLLLPALTRIRPRLSPLAAAGLGTVMALALAFHAARGEPAGMAITAVLGGLCCFVAWGRLRRAPIAPRA
jgi:putative oxidoreductase